MPSRARLLTAALVVVPAVLIADDPPEIDHQPWACTVPGKPISICAKITDDSAVARARVFFRATDEKAYNFVEMAFGGLDYCATLPAPRQGKIKSIDYYLAATDDGFNTQRTSTYLMHIQSEGLCEFPPIEKDAGRAASIKVFATLAKQGKRLPDEFDPSGVTFVPFGGR
jgi:hypothetical protein